MNTIYILVKYVAPGSYVIVEGHCDRDEAEKRANHFNSNPRNGQYEIVETELSETYMFSDGWWN